MNVELSLPPNARFHAELGIYDLQWSDTGRRKQSGSYYTPVCLIDCLLDHALEPILEQARLDGSSQELIRICDPACGTGHFLVPAARRIARRLAILSSRGAEPSAETMRQSLRLVIENCLYGVDSDPAAVELCKKNLWLEAGKPAELPTILNCRLLCGNSLLLDWPSTFPKVFAAGGFAAVLGNPPFVNAIEGAISPEMKKILAARSSDLRGTADLAFHFVKLSHDITRPGGRVGLVLPKTFLNAEAAAALRERLRGERPPSMLHVPRKAVYFPGAAAYTCLLVLGGDSICSISEDDSPQDANWKTGIISHTNWWRSAQSILGRLQELTPDEFIPLAERFEVTASMTAGDAYTLKPFVRDDRDGAGLKLVTTGLIDPFACKWGQEKCRYLGAIYNWPRIAANDEIPPSLSARLKKAATRPKLLVAGLCDHFEVFLDPRGEYLGAVSTYSIFDPNDNGQSLEALCVWLNSPPASTWLHTELGAASVGGGFMTLKKKTLKETPIPKRETRS